MAVSVYSVDQDKSFAVTDGLTEVTEPVFDRSGKYLYFLGSTDAGPVHDWFSQSERRHARDAKRLPGGAAKGPAVAAREGERRGRREEFEGRERYERRRKTPRNHRTSPGRRRPRTAAARQAETPHAETAVPDRLRRHPVRILDMPIPAGEPLEPAGRQRRAGLFHPRDRRQADAAAVRPREAQGRDRARGRRGLPPVGGRQEDALPVARPGSSCRRRRRS